MTDRVARRATASTGQRPVSGAGTVYLLHFSRLYGGPNPLGTAGHYIGWTTNLPGRLALHEAGQGARLLAAVHAAGITWTLARTWPGGRARERQIKRQGGARRCCPMCGVRPRVTGTGAAPSRGAELPATPDYERPF